MSFSDFNLNKDFIKSIEESGYKSPTELQTQLIPLVAERKSALIWSQSASGKTGAFLIPAMNYILENPAPEKRGARVLILTSRRDRVSQINYTIKRLSNDLVMRFGFIVSGRPYQTQMRLMRRPLDIMIATPGRLNDLMNNGKADFSQLEMLIIDDLSSIYKKNLQGLVENILQQAGPDCSSITFVRGDEEITPYATGLFPDAVQITVDEEEEEEEQDSTNEVAQQAKHPQQKTETNTSEDNNKNTNKNVNNNTNTNNNTENVKKVDIKSVMPQKVHIADDYTHKIAMMDYLMDEFSGESTLIYTATNKAAKTLQENLANHGHTAELINELNAEEFDECDILIYSDQDNNSFSNEELQTADTNIINFDLPHKTENYLKRLEHHNQDREKPTLLIIDGYNFNELKHLEKTFGEKLPQANIPGLEPLKPFVNLSKPKPKAKANNRPNQPKRNQNGKKNIKAKNPKNNTRRAKPGAKPKTNNNNSNNNTQKAADGASRRQHKGPFGRLNGGTHRKNNGKKVGVSRVGTDAPKDSGRGWQSDFAEPKERSADKDKPAVAIRYSKKRSLSVKRPKEIESPDPD